jgi:Fe-S-cluster-containing hydrogenase component 2
VGCPVGSIRRRNSLEIIIEDWCIGCGLCANNCPYGNINLHPFAVETPDPSHPGRMMATVRKKATGCDLCMEHKEPSCVYACPHDAAHRVEPLTFFGSMLSAGAGPQTGSSGYPRTAGSGLQAGRDANAATSK